MITSERAYKDLTVIRETVIRVGADWREHPQGEETRTVRVERRCDDRIEIIMPTEALFLEAVEATAMTDNPAIALGRKGRAVNSEAQRQAARANGAKGGRPRKAPRE